MKLIEYQLQKPFLTKSWGIWGLYEPNILMPIMYFQKPKRVSDEEWLNIMENIKITLPKDL